MLSPLVVVVIGGVAVLLFGTKKLPELGSGLGQAIANFTKAKQEMFKADSNDSADSLKSEEVAKLRASDPQFQGEEVVGETKL